LWNSGTESSPIKTKYDPCPEGWRVPTYAELNKLKDNYSSFTTVGGQKGRYFSGDYTYLDNAPQVFFPAAGERAPSEGRTSSRGSLGRYWASYPRGTSADDLDFTNDNFDFSFAHRAKGSSVRCVQE
jgi:uncharacterized protein (TIGR02145 family)